MIRKICYLGTPILRKKVKPVAEINDEIRKIAQELTDTVIAHNGLGLAAPQIGYDLRMFVVQVSDEVDEDWNGLPATPKLFINPKITHFSEERILLPEGCLSIPGFYEDVVRPEVIDIEATDLEGNRFQEKGLKRWRGRCCQHEMDHLDGILFIDRIPKVAKHERRQELRSLEEKFKGR